MAMSMKMEKRTFWRPCWEESLWKKEKPMKLGVVR
jgi:hypothetical protein